MLSVLVLGVGGNVSQGILKALAISSLRCRVIGACISATAFGLYTVHRAYVCPRADDPTFISWILRVCREERIDAILSGVEPVLDALVPHIGTIHQETGAITIISPPDRLAIAGDKLRTCEWLRDNGLNYPPYADGSDRHAIAELAQRVGYPLIAKPRRGKGAHGIFTIPDDTHREAFGERSGYVVQQYLGNERDEYTAGCFSDSAGTVRGCIVLRRGLQDGTTVSAQAGRFPEVRQEAVAIASALKPLGPCNIQMRMACGRPVCFEINLRFSGTTPIRARLGFNDVEAALRHYVLKEPAIDLPVIERGSVVRYWNEMYISPEATETLRQVGRLEEPSEHPSVLENYGMRR